MREWRIESFDEDGEPHATLASDLRSVLRLGLAAVLIVAASIPSVSNGAAPASGLIVLGPRHVEQPSPQLDRRIMTRDITITRDTITTCVRVANSPYGRATRVPVIPDLWTRCLSKPLKITTRQVTTRIEARPAQVWSLTLQTDRQTPRVVVILDPQTGQVRGYYSLPGD